LLDTTSCNAEGVVAQARHACDLGHFQQAWAWAPELAQIDDPQAGLVLSRMLSHVGQRRLAQALSLRLWRAHPGRTDVMVDAIRAQAYQRGPHRAWCLLQGHAPAPDASAHERAEYDSLLAYTLAQLRDFVNAERLHAQALAASPQDPWLRVEHSYSLELADRYDEALARADEALRLMPAYRPALQQKIDLLTLLGRGDEALALSRQASAQAESGALDAALHSLLMERGELAEAEQALDRCVRHWPWPDGGTLAWLNGHRADLELLKGRRMDALRAARAVPLPFQVQLADRLEKIDRLQKRVIWPVEFVRQHHNTCAPATLTALSRYWGRTVNHLEVAEEICYDGTAHHSERRWAESQGWWVREFTVDWATSQALLDAGVPFALTTTATQSGHLQAVIGYDDWRGSLLIRDPFKASANEFAAGPFFADQASNGPRGMLMLPPQEVHRIAHIPLPDMALWDSAHRVVLALTEHDRPRALSALAPMCEASPEHRLTLVAQRSLASYDHNDAEVLALTERLLLLHPHDANLSLAKARLLAVLGSREQVQAWWAEVMAQPRFDPVLAVRHAQFLMEDGRALGTAKAWLNRALRHAPTDASAWHALALAHGAQGQHEASLPFHRIASCLQDSNEYHAETYVAAARVVGQTEQAMAHLAHRVDRLGALAAGPWITHFQQLDLQERTAEGLALLERALSLRPLDPELLLFKAEVDLRHGRRDPGWACLQAASSLAKRTSWLRCQALFLRDEGRWCEAVEVAREVASLEPLNVDAHRTVVQWLSRSEGLQQAQQYLHEVASRHPQHFELQRLRLSLVPEDDTQAQAEVLDQMLAINPVDAWTHREKAFKLGKGRRLPEALEHAQTAVSLSPTVTQSHAALAYVQWRMGDLASARQGFRQALTLTVDNQYALSSLVDLETTREGRLQALAFIQQALVDQVTLGDGLLAFHEQAAGTLEPQALLDWLSQSVQWRPDLWQTWAALAMQHIRLGQGEEALRVLDQASERFPLLSRLPIERARALLLLARREEARESYLHALRLSPGWPWAVRMFVDSIGDEGRDIDRALPVLDQALLRQPDHADLLGLRAWVHCMAKRLPQALQDAQAGVQHDPAAKWIWDLLARAAQDLGQTELVSQTAEAVAASRPGDVLAWQRVAEFGATPQRRSEAADHGAQLEPRNEGMAHVRLNLWLAEGRHEDIAAFLAAPPWPEAVPPHVLAFKARSLRAQGQAQAAIEALLLLLQREPDQVALWRDLADWCHEAGRRDEQEKAARALVRLAPLHAMCHGYLGQALRAQGEPEEALQAYRKALVLDPSYRFAAFETIELLFERQAWDEADAQLHALEQGEFEAPVALRRLRWAQAVRHRQRGVDSAIALVTRSDLHPDFHTEAVKLIRHSPWPVNFSEAVEAAFKQGWCARPALLLWLEHQGGGWLPGALRRDVDRALAHDPSGALLRTTVLWAGDKIDRHWLDHLLRKHRAAITADVEAWALAGASFLTQRRHAQAIDWMKDWRQRADVPAWALDNLAYCLRQLLRDQEAAEVTARSLSLEPNNPDAWVWQAVDAARGRDHASLKQRLAQLEASELRPYYRGFRMALQAYQEAVQAGRSGLALRTFAQLKTAAREDKVLRKVLKSLCHRLVAEHTPTWLKPWRWLQFQVGWP
jgi:tetratricopeptide (TPR) repeat protein